MARGGREKEGNRDMSMYTCNDVQTMRIRRAVCSVTVVGIFEAIYDSTEVLIHPLC